MLLSVLAVQPWLQHVLFSSRILVQDPSPYHTPRFKSSPAQSTLCVEAVALLPHQRPGRGLAAAGTVSATALVLSPPLDHALS